MNWSCQCHRCVRSREVLRLLILAALVAFAMIFLAGCGNPSAAKPHIDYALTVCEPNAGLARMTVESAPNNTRLVTAYCNNAVVAMKNMEAK